MLVIVNGFYSSSSLESISLFVIASLPPCGLVKLVRFSLSSNFTFNLRQLSALSLSSLPPRHASPLPSITSSLTFYAASSTLIGFLASYHFPVSGSHITCISQYSWPHKLISLLLPLLHSHSLMSSVSTLPLCFHTIFRRFFIRFYYSFSY